MVYLSGIFGLSTRLLDTSSWLYLRCRSLSISDLGILQGSSAIFDPESLSVQILNYHAIFDDFFHQMASLAYIKMQNFGGNETFESQNAQFGSLDDLFNDNWNLLNQPQSSLDLDFWLTADLPQNNELEKVDVKSPETTTATKSKKRKAEREKRVVYDEEERRKRNTLASQKFRAEKKKKDTEMVEQNKKLEQRILDLELLLREKDVEINVMRSLLIQKSEH